MRPCGYLPTQARRRTATLGTMAGEADHKMVKGVRCGHCDAVIGVYEPMIVVRDGNARETSRAAEPLPLQSIELYHRDCFRARAGDAAA